MPQKSKRQTALKSQIKRLSNRKDKLILMGNRFTWYRLIIFFGGLVCGIFLYYLVNEWLGWSVIGLTLLVFNIVAHFHRKINSSIAKHQIWLQIKSTQLARITLDWQNIPYRLSVEQNPEHPFEIDLDLTGKRSLHQLMDTAVSREGSQRLREWLLQPMPDSSTIRNRQAVIRELTPLVRFRDKLWLAFNLASKAQLEGEKLLNWLDKQRIPKFFREFLIASTGLAIVNLILFILNMVSSLPAYWIISLTVYFIIYFMNFEIGGSLLDDSNMLSDELHKYKVILLYIEKYPFGANKNLNELRQSYSNPQTAPSTHLKYLFLLKLAIGLRMNILVRYILNAVLPWDFYFFHLMGKMKIILKNRFPVWVDILYELEALVSLSNFAYLNPEYVFPEIIRAQPDENLLTFKSQGLGHPLIPDKQKVCNDFSFSQPGETVLITGSNMSGKSTFLKTVGLNLCLAFAGGPVNAQLLKTSIFRIYTCIHINDSVTDGFSYFYAEVKRLKTLLDELKKDSRIPLLYLIDEIFKGTNNRERRIGGRSYIQNVINQNGLGIISTHDLELTKLAEKIPKLTNYHFKEEVIKGKMVFDYKIRSGPCPTTNALKIMRLEGLPVEDS